MADHDADHNRHFILDNVTSREEFRSPGGGGESKEIPGRDRQLHGNALLSQIEKLKTVMESAREEQEAKGLEEGFGLQIAFESFPDVELAFESLSYEPSGIELLNVRHENSMTYATVFVPEGKLSHFEKKIQAYLEEKRDRAGRSRDNSSLINTIQEIRSATLKELWTDDESAFPLLDNEVFWWEVWLPVRRDRAATVSNFRKLARMIDMRVADGDLQFPERTVLLVYTSAGQLKRSMLTLNSIAELRRAKETADFFDSFTPQEQAEWVNDLLKRTQIPSHEETVPYVCLFDTGVNRGHPLIEPALAAPDLHTVEPGWGTDDANGHGTQMAGLALVGDLTELLDSDQAFIIRHRLESVKLLNEDGGNTQESRHHGFLTVQAVARPEITAPERDRVICMTITAQDNRDRGRPSAWSAAIDRLAADGEGDGLTRRLLVISAGNIEDRSAWPLCPKSNSTDGIHDPGQAWNALTVGACTHLINITEPDAKEYVPIAPSGGLSPFSTTSATWQNHWPLKPDIVLEGGNAAKDTFGAFTMSSLSLLTTSHESAQRLFTTANATSAATALASRMAGHLMAEYPDLWPESIRALIVHSAKWTDAMLAEFLPKGKKPKKADYWSLVRHCGFGIPDLDRAMWSVSNSLTLVVEEDLQPFQREGSKQPTLRDMNLHELPWPLAELETLGETRVEMRVTLSYFIEPNPSERGFKSRYRYESHGLRFEVKRPMESVDEFRARINAKARDEEEGTRSDGSDPGWLIGIQNRHRGSIHSDIWRGTAAELASRGVLAVYPTAGWWKFRTGLQRYNRKTRYALIISIHTPKTDVDLYVAISNKIKTSVEIEG